MKPNNQDNQKNIHQVMDYRRPPSKRVKNAPARFRSDEETNITTTINKKRKIIQGQEVNLDSQVKGEIL